MPSSFGSKHLMRSCLSVMVVLSFAFILQTSVAYAESGAIERFSTPQLIEMAYANGAITAEERLQLFAYAIYEYESLPEEYHGAVGWYGTRYVRELHEAMNQVQSASMSAAQMEINRLLSPSGGEPQYCDQSNGPNSDQSTYFSISYDTILGGLTINDYKTSLDATYQKEVVDYGWAAPPSCTSGCSPQPNGRYPVQIVALGGSLFGYVTANNGDGAYAGFVGDNPNTPATETEARASCMVLNNDMAQFGGPGAQGNLDATTGHEYVHAIQNAYGDPGSVEEDAMWYESGASYMEDEVSDSSNSAYEYLWPTTTQCLGEWPDGAAPGGISEYSNFTFFRHVAEHNGGTNLSGGGEEIMQAFWENVAQNQDALVAYNNALASKGSQSTTLADAFHKYAATIKFSKACGGGYTAPYCFEEGAAYVAFKGGTTVPVQGTIASSGGSYSGSVLDHYAANYVQLPSTGTYNAVLENTAAGGKLRGSVVCDTGTTLNVTSFPAIANAGQTTSITNFDASSCASVVAVITNENQTSGNPSACTAHGYTVSTSGAIDVDARMTRALGSYTYDSTSSPPLATKGTLSINFDFNYNNNGGPPLNGIYVKVNTATQATMMNTDSGPGGVGAIKSIADSSLPGGDSLFSPNETLTVPFVIGIADTPWGLNFDLFGVEQPVLAAGNSEDDAIEAVYLGSFVIDGNTIRPVTDANTIFIPFFN